MVFVDILIYKITQCAFNAIFVYTYIDPNILNGIVYKTVLLLRLG